jgi:arylsulfatase A-like enzyme
MRLIAGGKRSTHRARALGILAAGLLCAGLLTPGDAPTQEAERGSGGRPNFVVIVTDDQTEASLNHRYMPRTRRLLVEKGTTFRDFVVTTPSCCPSRASMLTGSYAHNHRVLSNEIAYPGFKRPGRVLPVWLQRAGYRTGHVGKFLNGYEKTVSRQTVPAPGWHDWHTLLSYRYYNYSWSRDGKDERYGDKPGDYVTRTINQTSTRLLRRYAEQPKPFYLQVDQFAPHQTNVSTRRCEKAPIPDPRDVGRFSDESLPERPNFNEGDVSDKRSFMSQKNKLSPRRVSSVRRRFRCRVESLAAVDRGTQEIWQTLQQTGQADDTIVIFTSDNGFFAGEHRLEAGKTMPYVESSKVPFVVRAPRRFTGGERVRRVRDLAANIDIAPTVLDYANAEPCSGNACRTMDGRSLARLLRGRHWQFDRDVVIEYGSGQNRETHVGACHYTGVRREDAIYVRYNLLGDCGPSDERELYDLDADPFELENRNGDPAFEPTRVDMHASLNALRDCAGIQGRDAPDPNSSGFCE